MTALALNQQIDNHGRSEGVRSFAAGCRGYRPAGLTPRRQEHDGFPPRGGFVVPPKLGRGFRAPVLSRVGWCFNTARDFLEFHALTRSGIQPLHASALLGTPSLQSSPTIGIDPCAAEPMIEPAHTEVLSSVAVRDDQHRDRQDLEPCSLSRGIEYPR